MPRGHRRSRHPLQTCGSEAGGGDEAVAVDRAERTVVFTKTKMCKFHILGMCSKGAGCRFAHHKDELHPLPDLSRTKLCKTLIATGSCEDPDCRYAHNREELRALPEGVSLFGDLPEGRVFRTARGSDSARGREAGPPAQPALSPAPRGASAEQAADHLPESKYGFSRAVSAASDASTDIPGLRSHSRSADTTASADDGGTSGTDAPPEEERRRGADAPSAAAAPAVALPLAGASGPAAVPEAPQAEAAAAPSPRAALQEPAGSMMSVLGSGGLIVKNTFLQFSDDLEEERVPLRAVRTAAGRLDLLG